MHPSAECFGAPHHIGRDLRKAGSQLVQLVGVTHILRVLEMLPCNSLTCCETSDKGPAFQCHRPFAAFLNVVLNCLKGLHDWQLLGHMDYVLCSPVLLGTKVPPLLGTRLVNLCSLSLQAVSKHKRIVCKFKIITLKVSQFLVFANSQAFSS